MDTSQSFLIPLTITAHSFTVTSLLSPGPSPLLQTHFTSQESPSISHYPATPISPQFFQLSPFLLSTGTFLCNPPSQHEHPICHLVSPHPSFRSQISLAEKILHYRSRLPQVSMVDTPMALVPFITHSITCNCLFICVTIQLMSASPAPSRQRWGGCSCPTANPQGWDSVPGTQQAPDSSLTA